MKKALIVCPNNNDYKFITSLFPSTTNTFFKVIPSNPCSWGTLCNAAFLYNENYDYDYFIFIRYDGLIKKISDDIMTFFKNDNSDISHFPFFKDKHEDLLFGGIWKIKNQLFRNANGFPNMLPDGEDIEFMNRIRLNVSRPSESMLYVKENPIKKYKNTLDEIRKENIKPYCWGLDLKYNFEFKNYNLLINYEGFILKPFENIMFDYVLLKDKVNSIEKLKKYVKLEPTNKSYNQLYIDYLYYVIKVNFIEINGNDFIEALNNLILSSSALQNKGFVIINTYEKELGKFAIENLSFVNIFDNIYQKIL